MVELQILVYIQVLYCVLPSFEGKEKDFLGSNKTAVHIKDYNFYAIVTPVGQYGTYCGATLISPLYLISAYHCIKFSSPETKWKAYFEVEDKCYPHKGDLTVGVSRIYFHGKSVVDKNQIKDDLALLKLVREVTSITPAKLPELAPSPGEVGVIIGYEARRPRPQSRRMFLEELATGKKYGPTCPLQRKLQMVQNNSSCVEGDGQKIPEGQFCSYNPPASSASCRFDSGGPWFHETRPGYKILVGVSTFGDFFCKPNGINGLYTNVHAYLGWIKNVMKGKAIGDVRVVSYDNDDDDDDGYDDEEDENEGEEEEEDNNDNDQDDEEDENDDEEKDDDNYSDSDDTDGGDTESYDDIKERDDDYVNNYYNLEGNNEDDYYEEDEDNDEDEDENVDYENEWIPAGSEYVIGPPFIK